MIKAQGSIEYLLIIAAAILVVAIVIIAVTGALSSGQEQNENAIATINQNPLLDLLNNLNGKNLTINYECGDGSCDGDETTTCPSDCLLISFTCSIDNCVSTTQTVCESSVLYTQQVDKSCVQNVCVSTPVEGKQVVQNCVYGCNTDANECAPMTCCELGECNCSLLTNVMLTGPTTSAPTKITDCIGLQNIKENVNGSYYLGNDVNCYDDTHTGGVLNNAELGFEPIANFTGFLDGRGFTTDGLNINRPTEINGGLFANTTSTAIIQNLGLTNIYLKSDGASGPITGINNGKINRVYATGTNQANVLGNTNNLGGIAGINASTGSIINSYSTVIVQIINYYGNSVGGITGTNYGNITNCYSAGSRSLPYGNTVGGVAGTNYSTIKNCFATENTVYNTSSYRGGLVGFNSSGNVENSSWVSKFSGTEYNQPFQAVGGSSTGTCTNCIRAWLDSEFYANTNPIYQANPAWDFTRVWQSNPTALPTLRPEGNEINLNETKYFMFANVENLTIYNEYGSITFTEPITAQGNNLQDIIKIWPEFVEIRADLDPSFDKTAESTLPRIIITRDEPDDSHDSVPFGDPSTFSEPDPYIHGKILIKTNNTLSYDPSSTHVIFGDSAMDLLSTQYGFDSFEKPIQGITEFDKVYLIGMPQDADLDALLNEINLNAPSVEWASKVSRNGVEPKIYAKDADSYYVIGSVHPTGDFIDYKLYFADLDVENEDGWTLISTGNNPIDYGVIATWNTSSVPDGHYALRLIINETDTINFMAQSKNNTTNLVKENNIYFAGGPGPTFTTSYSVATVGSLSSPPGSVPCGTTLTASKTLSAPIAGTGGLNDYITIGADNVTLNCNNQTIVNCPIKATGVKKITIKNCKIYGSSYPRGSTAYYMGIGIKFDSVTESNVLDNTLKYNLTGVELKNSSNNRIKDNNASNDEIGINLYKSSGNIIEKNDTKNNTQHGIILFMGSSNNNLTDNNASDNRAPSSGDGITIAHNSSGNYLTDNTATNNKNCGIKIYPYTWAANDNNLSGNKLTLNKVGICLEDTNGNTIKNNTITDNTENGIYLNNSQNNILTDNNSSNNTENGILLINSIKNTLTTNHANGNNTYNGIAIIDSNENTLTSNITKNNAQAGILLGKTGTIGSKDNDLTSNTATDNKIAGILLDGASDNTLTTNNANENKIISTTTNEGQGIRLINKSKNNTLLQNKVLTNEGDGIFVDDDSANNNLTGNEVRLNYNGINLKSDSTARDNIICGNAIKDAIDTGSSSLSNNTCKLFSSWIDDPPRTGGCENPCGSYSP